MAATSALYLSNCFQMVHAKGWSFIVPLMFASLGGDNSMKLLTMYGTAVSVAQLAAVPLVGILVDLLRLKSAAVLSFLSHVCVMVSCAVFLSMVDGPEVPFLAQLLFVAGGAGSEILGDFNSIIMEMKVTPALVPKDDKQKLVAVTSAVKRTKFLARTVIPVLVGFYASLSDSVHVLVTGMLLLHFVTAGVNATCWAVLLAAVPVGGDEHEGTPTHKSEVKKKNSSNQGLKGFAPVLGCCLSYGIMYCSVLSATSSVFTATLKRRGVSSVVLGGARSAGAMGGLLGTVLWPLLYGKVGLALGASLSLVAYTAFTALAMPCLAASPILALGCLTAARPFFCMFELGIVNILQDRVKSSMRGRAVIFYELSYVLSMVGMDVLSVFFHKKEEFWILCVVSIVTTSFGCVLFLTCVRILCHKKPNDPGSEIPVAEYRKHEVPTKKPLSFKQAVSKVKMYSRFVKLSGHTRRRPSMVPQERHDADLSPILALHSDDDDDSE